MRRIVEVLLPGVLSQPVQLLEIGLTVCLLVLLRLRPHWLAFLDSPWRRLTRRPALFMASLALALLAVHAVVDWGKPRRAPAIHDEFGYLLTARTFNEGRLTNPTPPEWQALDTIHVNFVPSYNSMYPPGQPAVLAAAWRVAGAPIYANWVLAPLVGVATWWMLAGWLPSRWALLGGTLVMLRLGIFGYWAESYMTGALPAIAAQVFIGALPRLARRPSMGIAAAGATGLAVMFSSRPFEAVVLGGCGVLIAALSIPPARRFDVLRAGLPGAVLFVAVTGAVAICNVALTGSPVRFGYDLNMVRHGYGVFTHGYQSTSEPLTAHMAAFYDETRRYAAYGWTVGGFIGTRLRTVTWTWVFLVGPLLTLGLSHWRRALAVHRLRPALPGLLGFAIVTAAHPWSFPHYHAGALGFFALFGVTAIRLWAVRHGLPPVRVGGAVAATAALVLAVRCVAGNAVVHAPLIAIEYLPYHMPQGLDARRDFEATAGREGPALVFVRYANAESLRRDWVYNAPSPQQARVVWVNDRGASANVRTARAYPGRRAVCIAIVDGHPRDEDCASWLAAGAYD